MKIFVAHASQTDYQKDLYNPLKESPLFSKHTFLLPHDQKDIGSTKRIIQDTDLLLAEVSVPSVGVGIELGWADAAGIKIICFYKENSYVSSSLKIVTDDIISYKDTDDMINKLVKLLS